MATSTQEIGGLKCHLYDELPPGEQPQVVAIFCHGFGAGGDDLLGLGPEFVLRKPELASAVRFVFPEAPLSLEELGMPGARAWWHLDMAKLTAAVERGEFRDQRQECPEGLTLVREKMTELVGELCEQSALEPSRIVLGGFSQGAMLATDVALRLPVSPGLLCVLSGTLLCEDAWRALAEKRGKLPVFQSHGNQDPLLPFQSAEWLRDMFTESGMDVEFLSFTGPHTIPAAAVHRIASRFARIIHRVSQE